MALHGMRIGWAALLLAPWVSAQTARPATNLSSTQGKSALTIHLERLRKEHIEPMRADHVFDVGDVIRFRVTSGFDGYLYVVNQGSSGGYSVLFPAPGGRTDNSIGKTSEYLVPSAGDGWFEVYGPAGFDTLFFLLSPTPLGGLVSAPAGPGPGTSAAPRPTNEAPSSSLTPRCDDAIFRARGECTDSSAGPAPLARGAPLPPQLSAAAPNASRDIVVVNEAAEAVSVSTSSDGPVVYTFRLAHK